ncbi:MAG TPA: alpha/beta fold hydrolase [Anaerolineae bacterium]|nr:alpha/beta fold hydrolase [Anaerolineae bacterium]HQI84016.1 alpha/beta fold hydrolase [Anaerolineae bacterium]
MRTSSAGQNKTQGWRHRLIRMLRLFTFGLVAAFVMLGAGYEIIMIEVMTRPFQGAVCCATPADWGFQYENVTFTSNDGIRLAGWHIPTQNGATIILLHGYNAHRLGMAWHAQVLARHGYGILMYDLRAHGESTGNIRSFGWADVNDVSAAVDFLAAQADVDPERIGILGFSMGGQIALRAAAQTERLRAVIADDPSFGNTRDAGEPHTFTDYIVHASRWILFRGIALRSGVRPPAPVIEVIGDIAPRPLLVISSNPGADNAFRRYYDYAKEPKALWVVPNAWHGGNWSVAPAAYEQTMVTFFDQALLDTP